MRFKLHQITLILITLTCATGTAETLPQFITDLSSEFESQCLLKDSAEYQEVCRKLNLAPENETNKATFATITLVHDLMTGTSARDCSSGGILHIPYFWHWIKPNPRHSIRHLPDSLLLTKLKPPSGYGQYKTFADVDRRPALFLSDMVSAEPGYYHPDCGSFYTFGWCSEREMAFSCLMKVLGYRSKIVQSGIHTWSVVLLAMTKTDGTESPFEVFVDNTFDMVNWGQHSDRNDRTWESDFGAGTQIEWYNSIASSEAEVDKVRQVEVPETSADRIRLLIKEFY